MKLLFLLALILTGSIVAGCSTIRPVDAPTLRRYEGFIQDGSTTRQEIENRLGNAQSVYESGRILIYHVYLHKDGRMSLTRSGTCHACVLVFDKDGTLERHSLVKDGCR